MFSFAAILAVGFLLGMRHATDPDHVVAVTTIVAKQRGLLKAGFIGMFWGLGHTFTIFVVGTMIILFQITIPTRLGLSMELAVAVMLILLGVLNLTGILPWLQDKFTSGSQPLGSVGISVPRNVAVTPADASSRRLPENEQSASSCWISPDLGLYNTLRPLVVGIVHGLAGSAAVAMLVMTAIRNPWWAIAYLLLFGVGTIAGMMSITVVMAMPITYAGRRFSRWNHRMAIASGLLSIGFGLFLTYQIGFVDGLFTTHPTWAPH